MKLEHCFDNAISGLDDSIKKALTGIDACFKRSCNEIRIRAEKPIIVVCGGEKFSVDANGKLTDSKNGLLCTKQMLTDSFSRICDYSVHTHSSEIVKGYVTVKGGHRVGVTGTAVLDGKNNITAIRDISSLSIRGAKVFNGCCEDIFEELYGRKLSNVILAGPPSSGKTTVLRDLVRVLSYNGKSVSVIDERQEIAAMHKGICCNDVGINTDVYFGYPKEHAINMAVRTMSPDIIAVDEICDENEVNAIVRASNCGVGIVVTVHASDLRDIASKHQTLSLLRTGVFDKIVILERKNNKYNKSVHSIEEINDEIYRCRAYMDEYFPGGSENIRAV